MDNWGTLRATIQSQMKKSLDNSNSGKDEENWQGHASALLYVLSLMRQIEEPNKRHTTGHPLPLITIEEKENLREELASLAHEQWSGWMQYLFSKGSFNDDGTFTIPDWAVKRWQRQMNTGYNKLSAPEQESDRKEADKFLALMK